MAPPVSARTEREKKLKSLLAFASSLEKRFASFVRDASLPDDLERQLHNLPLPPSSTVMAKQDELDRLGTELWNLSTRLRRDEAQQNGRTRDSAEKRRKTLCLLRVFAFLLLDSAAGQASKGPEIKSYVRLAKVALKAARTCLDVNDFGNATIVLGRAADYQVTFEAESAKELSGEASTAVRLRAEYLAMRIALAWRQDNLVTAEHMFANIKQLDIELEPSVAEDLADLLYEVGKDLVSKHNYEHAARWLERSFDLLGEHDLDRLSLDAGDLRLSVMQTLVQAYIKTQNPEAESKSWELVNLMEAEYGDRTVVSLLKLELIAARDTINSDQYYAVVLLRMIRSIILSEVNFKTIMHHILRLKEHSDVAASKALDNLIEIRLFAEEDQEKIEKAIITRIWVVAMGDSSNEGFESLFDLFENVSRNLKRPLSAAAVHAAQTLLWKNVEATFNQEQYALTEKWCELSLHTIFEKSGELNKATIARKVILCALARQDHASARVSFSKMPDAGKNEPITRYLMYKVALRSGDADFASECLDVVCRQSLKDATLLYACVLEAQNSGDKRQAILALEKVLDKYNYSAPAGIHLPAMLRCTARLLVSELTKNGTMDPGIVDEVCKVFEGAAIQAKSSRKRPVTAAQQVFTSAEFEWFCKTAYNLSLKQCVEMHPRSLARLLAACIEFIKLLMDQDQPGNKADLALRLMFCDFLAACAYTTLARAEDKIEDCLQYYLEVRHHCKSFRATATEQLQSDVFEDATRSDIISKRFQVVKLELEAALKLEDWDSLDGLFEECWKWKDQKQLETLADLVLVIQSCMAQKELDKRYHVNIIGVLQKIINEAFRGSTLDIAKLSRWIRCLFRLALTFDENVSIKCIDQAAKIAGSRQGGPNPYPSSELEWLASTSFNQAVDAFMANDEGTCRKWGEKACMIAHWADDDGALRNELMGKFKGMRFSEE